MFVIFGIRRLGKVLATLSYVCGNCGQAAAHRIYTRWTFFSLFFLPVLPLGRKQYHSQCIGCGAERKLTRQEAELIVGGAPTGSSPVAAR